MTTQGAESPVRAGIGAHWPAVVGTCLIVLIFFWPVFDRPTELFLADGADGAMFIWSYWYTGEAIGNGDSPFATDLIFYPVGARLSFNTNTPLMALLHWPLARALGPVIGYNLLLLAGVVAAALAAYAIAYRLCGRRLPSFVAGIAFTFVPYRFFHLLGHHNLTHYEVVALGVLAIVCFSDRPTTVRAVMLGVAFGCTVLTDLYYTTFLIVALVVVMAARFREMVTRAAMARLLIGAGIAAVIASPLLVSMIGDLRNHELDPIVGWGGAHLYSADLVSWVVPFELHPWWGERFHHLNTRYGGERLAYPGLAMLGIGVVGAVVGRRDRRVRLWLALAAVFFVLSLGPFLQVATHQGGLFHLYDTEFNVPLPYLLLRFVPVLNGVRVPARFAIVAILAIHVVAAYALSRLPDRRRLGTALTLVVLAVVIVESLRGPLTFFDKEIPPAYAVVAADPSPGAVLEIPIQWRAGVAAYGDVRTDHTIFQYWATNHGRPIVSGATARYPAWRIQRLQEIPVIRQVLALQAAVAGSPVEASFTVDDLRALGIRFVVYHRDRPAPAVYDHITRLAVPVVADDGTIIVFRVPD